MINVLFRPEADQPYRQQAIDLVKGRVVGGVKLFEDGYYIVEVPNDGRTLEGVDQAIVTLQSLELVLSVFRVAPPQPVVIGAPEDARGPSATGAWSGDRIVFRLTGDSLVIRGNRDVDGP